MNDFWEWMEKNEYGECEFISDRETYCLYSGFKVLKRPPIQMLIGYMIEYLCEKEGSTILNAGGKATIQDVYDWYAKDIHRHYFLHMPSYNAHHFLYRNPRHPENLSDKQPLSAS